MGRAGGIGRPLSGRGGRRCGPTAGASHWAAGQGAGRGPGTTGRKSLGETGGEADLRSGTGWRCPAGDCRCCCSLAAAMPVKGGTKCIKYLLFGFNFIFWVRDKSRRSSGRGGAVPPELLGRELLRTGWGRANCRERRVRWSSLCFAAFITSLFALTPPGKGWLGWGAPDTLRCRRFPPLLPGRPR